MVTVWAVELIGKFHLCVKEKKNYYHVGGETLEMGPKDTMVSLSVDMLKT